MLPAGAVPVSSQVGCLQWHHHNMTGAFENRLIAARADVGLEGLKWLDERHFHRQLQKGVEWRVVRHPNSVLITG